ncbi:hypothetical protein SAMN04487833_13822 [Sarcina sp. DSM 11001]|nr:hypothetical protein SAMN04487833_13822 [Sarcina sp. DSM 11001]
MFICNGGSRKSTRHYRRTKNEIKADERILRTINEKSLLFSSQLNRIKITFSNGKTAAFQRLDHNNICTITARRVTESKEKSFDYVCFTSDDNPYTGIAFALKPLKNDRYQIIPCSGVVMNGPNTTDMPTNLQFVISGSFRVKDGMPDSNSSEENQEAVEDLATVMESCIKNVLHQGLLGMSFFSVLPNSSDEKSFINAPLIRAIKTVCSYYPLFKNRKGTIVSRNSVAYGTEDVTKLFPQEIAGLVLGNKYWVEPCNAGSREERFLIDVGIPFYDRERFLKELFRKENLDDCSRILKEQNDRWLRSFYIFCSEPVADDTTKRLIISGLKSIRSIRDSKGNMQYPGEISLAAQAERAGKKSIIVKPDLISPSGSDDEYSAQIRDFFLNDLRIKEYSQKPEMEALASSMMSKRQPIDRTYAGKLLSLAKFDKACPGEIDFSAYAIFPFESSRGLRRANANELVIGKPFVREGNLLASATKRNPIWKGLKALLSEEDLDIVLAFAERSGAIGLPRIIRQKAEKHRDFSDRLLILGRQGARDTDYDYTIPGLEDLLKRRSLQLSRLVWDALRMNDNSDAVLHAEYSVNNRTVVNRSDSSLILILRERTWVPGKDGKFYMPENIKITDIHEDLVFDKDNPILHALNFGSGIKKREKAIKDLEKLAAREGLRLISEEEYQEFIKWKKQTSPQQ